MGLEVRYRGRIRNIDSVEPFEQQAVRIATALRGWSMLWNSPDNPDPSPVRGITLQVLPNQPLISLLIAPTGELISLQTAEACELGRTPSTLEWCVVCTEQSGLPGHRLLLTLLAVLRQHWFPDLEVQDSSGQWPLVTNIAELQRFNLLIQNESLSPTFSECLAAMQPDDSRCCCDCDDRDDDYSEDNTDEYQSCDDDTFSMSLTLKPDDAGSENNACDESVLRLFELPPGDSLRLHVRTLHNWARLSRCVCNSLFDPADTVATRALLMMVYHCNCTEELLPLRYAPNINSQIQDHLQRILWFARSMQFSVSQMTIHQRMPTDVANTGQAELQHLCHKVQQLLVHIP